MNSLEYGGVILRIAGLFLALLMLSKKQFKSESDGDATSSNHLFVV